MCIKWKAFVACDPAQDSANLVQALAAVVNTCTNESNPAKWSITITNAPVIVMGNSPASNSTNYATLACWLLLHGVGFGLKPVSDNSGIIGDNSGIVGGTTGRGIGNGDILHFAGLLSLVQVLTTAAKACTKCAESCSGSHATNAFHLMHI